VPPPTVLLRGPVLSLLECTNPVALDPTWPELPEPELPLPRDSRYTLEHIHIGTRGYHSVSRPRRVCLALAHISAHMRAGVRGWEPVGDSVASKC
jgi:hypothetical protein